MKNTIAERIFDFLKNFSPFDILSRDQLSILSKKIKAIYLLKEISLLSHEGSSQKNLIAKEKLKFKKPLFNPYGRRLL